jgi:hypothetical protein
MKLSGVLSAVLLSASTGQTGLPSRPETGVYAVVFEQRFHGALATNMPVSRMTVALPPPIRSGLERWAEERRSALLAKFSDMPSDLRDALRRSTSAKPVLLDVTLLPPGKKIVPEGTDPRLELSEVRFGKNRLDALVYAQWMCQGLCGEGGYFWIRRNTSDSPWFLFRRVVDWMS